MGRVIGRSGLLTTVEIGQISVRSAAPPPTPVVFPISHTMYPSMNTLHRQEADMSPCTRGKVSNWSFATVVGEALPPRDPDDDETEDEEDDEQDEDLDPAVIREPDE